MQSDGLKCARNMLTIFLPHQFVANYTHNMGKLAGYKAENGGLGFEWIGYRIIKTI